MAIRPIDDLIRACWAALDEQEAEDKAAVPYCRAIATNQKRQSIFQMREDKDWGGLRLSRISQTLWCEEAQVLTRARNLNPDRLAVARRWLDKVVEEWDEYQEWREDIENIAPPGESTIVEFDPSDLCDVCELLGVPIEAKE